MPSNIAFCRALSEEGSFPRNHIRDTVQDTIKGTMNVIAFFSIQTDEDTKHYKVTNKKKHSYRKKVKKGEEREGREGER